MKSISITLDTTVASKMYSSFILQKSVVAIELIIHETRDKIWQLDIEKISSINESKYDTKIFLYDDFDILITLVV